MAYQDIMNMSAGDYVEMLQDAAYDILDNPGKRTEFLGSKKGHAELHHDAPAMSLVDRIVHENVSAASCFFNKETALDAIANAVLLEAPNIARWAQMDEFGNRFNDNFYEYDFTVNMGRDEYIGFGIDKNLKRFESSAVHIVLQRDRSPDTDFGFYMKTAFLDLDEKYCHYTGEEYRIEDLVNGDLEFKNDIDKLASLCRYHVGSPDSVQYLSERTNGEPPKMVMRYLDKQERMDIYLNEEGFAIRKRTPKGTKRLSREELGRDYPERLILLREMEKALDKLGRDEKIEVDRRRYHVNDEYER